MNFEVGIPHHPPRKPESPGGWVALLIPHASFLIRLATIGVVTLLPVVTEAKLAVFVDGRVLNGPATMPLRTWPCRLDEGRIIVDLGD